MNFAGSVVALGLGSLAAAGLAAPAGLAPAAGLAPVAVPVSDGKPAEFAPPVRLKAGEAFLGGGRYYPSPVLHDLDGDGRSEVLVADLMGSVTYAKIARAEDRAPAVSAETPLLGRDGKPIRFHNW